MGSSSVRSGGVLPEQSMARNLRAWHDSSVRALGIPTFRSPSVWWRGAGGSPIYLSALILDARVPDAEVLAVLERVQATPIHVHDCGAAHDLSALGFERSFATAWYMRAAGAVEPCVLPGELTIEVVTSAEELADFERATCLGFETPEPVRFAQHAPQTLEDPGMHYLNARLGGQVVASTIAYVTDDMLGIYGISTLPAHRRRGFGTALVHAAVALRPDLPASVHPEPVSVPMYVPRGFAPAGEIAAWKKETA